MSVSLKHGKIICINIARPRKKPPTTKLDHKYRSDLIDLVLSEYSNVICINSDINSDINAEVCSFNPNLEWW